MSKSALSLKAGRPSARKSKEVTLASLSDEKEQKRVNFFIDSDLHTKLKIYAAQQGKSIKDILTDYIKTLPFN